jgi:hypothetical protein
MDTSINQAARSSQQMADHVGVINDWMLGHRNMAWVSAFMSKQTVEICWPGSYLVL